MHNPGSALQVKNHTEGDKTTSSAANSMLIWLLLSFPSSSRQAEAALGEQGPPAPGSARTVQGWSSPHQRAFGRCQSYPIGVPIRVAAPWGAPWAQSLPSNRFRALRSVLRLLMRLESVGCQLPTGISQGGSWAEAHSKGRSFSVHEGAWEDLGRRLGRWLA